MSGAVNKESVLGDLRRVVAKHPVPAVPKVVQAILEECVEMSNRLLGVAHSKDHLDTLFCQVPLKPQDMVDRMRLGNEEDPVFGHRLQLDSEVSGPIFSLWRSLESLEVTTRSDWTDRIAASVVSSAWAANNNNNSNSISNSNDTNGININNNNRNDDDSNNINNGNDNELNGNVAPEDDAPMFNSDGSLNKNYSGEAALKKIAYFSGSMAMGMSTMSFGSTSSMLPPSLELDGWTVTMSVCHDVVASLVSGIERMRSDFVSRAGEEMVAAIDASGHGRFIGGAVSRLVKGEERRRAAELENVSEALGNYYLGSVSTTSTFSQAVHEVEDLLRQKHGLLERHEKERRVFAALTARGEGSLRVILTETSALKSVPRDILAAASVLDVGITDKSDLRGSDTGNRSRLIAEGSESPFSPLIDAYKDTLAFLSWGAFVLSAFSRAIAVACPHLEHRTQLGGVANASFSGNIIKSSGSSGKPPSLEECASTLSGAVDIFAELSRAVLGTLSMQLDGSVLFSHSRSGKKGRNHFGDDADEIALGGAFQSEDPSMQQQQLQQQLQQIQQLEQIQPVASLAAYSGNEDPFAGDQGNELMIQRGTKESVEIPVETSGSIIRWVLRVSAHDVGVELVYISVSTINIDGNKVEQVSTHPVVSYSRKNAGMGFVRGEHTAEEPGRYALIFDNSYALMTDKVVTYRWEVEPVGARDEDLPFFLRKPATHERAKH